MMHALKEVNAYGSAWQNPTDSPSENNSPTVVDGVKIYTEDRDASWITRPNSSKRRMTVTIFDNMIRNRSRRFSYVGDRPRTSNLFATSGIVAAMYAAVCDPEYGIDADPLTIFNDRMCTVEKRKKPNERYYMFARESSKFLFDDVRMFTKEPEYDSYAVISRGEQMLIRATPRPVPPAVPENRAQSAILMDLLYGTPPPGYNLPSIAGLPAPAELASEKKRGGKGAGRGGGEDKRDRALRMDASALKVHTKSAAEGARNLDAMLKKRAAGRNAGLEPAAGGAAATPQDRLAEENRRGTRRLMGRLDPSVAVEISVTSDAIAQMAELVHKNIDFVSDLRKADREAARLMTMRKELMEEGILAPWWTGYPDLFSQVRKVVRLVRGGKYFAYDTEFLVRFCAYAAATVASHRVARPLQIYLNEYELLTGGFKDLPLLKVPERQIRFAVQYNDNDRLPRLMSPRTEKYVYARALDDAMKEAVSQTWVLLDRMEKHANKKRGLSTHLSHAASSSSDGEEWESDDEDGGEEGAAGGGNGGKRKERVDGRVTFMVSLTDDMVHDSKRWAVFACNKRTAREVDARAIVVDYQTYGLWVWIVREEDYDGWLEAHDNGALRIRDGRQKHDFGRWMCAFRFMLVGHEFNVSDAILSASMKKSVEKETAELERVVLGKPSTSREKGGKTKEQKRDEAGAAVDRRMLTDTEIDTIRDDISHSFISNLEDARVTMYMVIETEGRRVHYASTSARGAFSNTQSFAGCDGGSKKKCAWLGDHRLRMLHDYPVRADAPIVEADGDDELDDEVRRMHDGDEEFMGEARFSEFVLKGVLGVGHRHVNIRRVYMIYPELYRAAVQLCRADVRVGDVRRILAPLKTEGDGRRYLHVLRLLERHLKAHALEIAPLVDPGFVDKKCTPQELLYYETLLMSTYENEPMGTVTWSTRKWETINPREGRLTTERGRLLWSRVSAHYDSDVPVKGYPRTYDTNTRTMISMSLDQVADVCSARADQYVYVSDDATDDISHMMLVLWSSVVWFTVYFQWGHSTFWDAYGRYHYVLSRARRKPCEDNAAVLEKLARFLADQEVSAYNLVIHNFNSVRSYLIAKVYKDFTLTGTRKEIMPRQDETRALFESLKTSVRNMINEIWKKRHSFAPPNTYAFSSRWAQMRPDYVRGELFSKINHILAYDKIALESRLRARFQQELAQYHEMRALYASDPVKYSDIPEIARRIWGDRATADLAAALNAGDHDMSSYEQADDAMDTSQVTETMVESAKSVIVDIQESLKSVEMTDASTDADALLRVLHNTHPNDVHRQHVGHVVIDTVINGMPYHHERTLDTEEATEASKVESNINTAIAIVSYIANTLGITDVDEKKELYDAVLKSNFDAALVDEYVRKQFSAHLPLEEVVASVASAMAVPPRWTGKSGEGADPRKDARNEGRREKRDDDAGGGAKTKRKKDDGDEDDDDGRGGGATRKLIETELASLREARASTHDALLKSPHTEGASVLVKYSEGLHAMETALVQQLIAEQARAGLVAAPPNVAAADGTITDGRFDERLEALVKSQQDILQRIDDGQARMADISAKMAASLDAANRAATASVEENREWFDAMAQMKSQNEEQLRALKEEYKEVGEAIKTFVQDESKSNLQLATVFDQLRRELGVRVDGTSPDSGGGGVERERALPVVNVQMNGDWEEFSRNLGIEVARLLRQNTETMVSTVMKPMVEQMKFNLVARDDAFMAALKRLMDQNAARAEQMSSTDVSVTKSVIEGFERSVDAFIDKNKTLFGQSTEDLKDIKEALVRTASAVKESVAIMSSSHGRDAAEATSTEREAKLLEHIQTLRGDIVRIQQQTNAINERLHGMANVPVTVQLNDDAIRCLTGINAGARCGHGEGDDDCIVAGCEARDHRGRAAAYALDAAYGVDPVDRRDNSLEFVLPPMPLPPTIESRHRSRSDREESPGGSSSQSSEESEKDIASEAVEIAKRLVEKEKRKREQERSKRHRERRKMETAYLKTMQEYQNTLRKHFDDLRAAYKEKCKLVMRSQNVFAAPPAQCGRMRRVVETRATRGMTPMSPMSPGGDDVSEVRQDTGGATGSLGDHRSTRLGEFGGNYQQHLSRTSFEDSAHSSAEGGGNATSSGGAFGPRSPPAVAPETMDYSSLSVTGHRSINEPSITQQHQAPALQEWGNAQQLQRTHQHGGVLSQTALSGRGGHAGLQAGRGGDAGWPMWGYPPDATLRYTFSHPMSTHDQLQDMYNFSRVGTNDTHLPAARRSRHNLTGSLSLPLSQRMPHQGLPASSEGPPAAPGPREQLALGSHGGPDTFGTEPTVPVLPENRTNNPEAMRGSASARIQGIFPGSYSESRVLNPDIVCDVQSHDDDVSEDAEKNKTPEIKPKTPPSASSGAEAGSLSDATAPPKHYVEPVSPPSARSGAEAGSARKKARGGRRCENVPDGSLPATQSLALSPVVDPVVFLKDEGWGASLLFSRRSRRLGNANAVARTDPIALPPPPTSPLLGAAGPDEPPPSPRRKESISSDEPRARTDEPSRTPGTKRKRSRELVGADRDADPPDVADDWNTALLWGGTAEGSPPPIGSGGHDAAANPMETSDPVSPATEVTPPPSSLWIEHGAPGVPQIEHTTYVSDRSASEILVPHTTAVSPPQLLEVDHWAPGVPHTERGPPPLLYLEPPPPRASDDLTYGRDRSITEILVQHTSPLLLGVDHGAPGVPPAADREPPRELHAEPPPRGDVLPRASADAVHAEDGSVGEVPHADFPTPMDQTESACADALRQTCVIPHDESETFVGRPSHPPPALVGDDGESRCHSGTVARRESPTHGDEQPTTTAGTPVVEEKIKETADLPPPASSDFVAEASSRESPSERPGATATRAEDLSPKQPPFSAIDAHSPDSPPKESTSEEHNSDAADPPASTAASEPPPPPRPASPITVRSRLEHNVPHTRVFRSPSPAQEQRATVTPSSTLAPSRLPVCSGRRTWYARIQARAPVEVIKKRKSRKKINFGSAAKPPRGRRSRRTRNRCLPGDGSGEEEKAKEVNREHFVPPFASASLSSTDVSDTETGPLASLGGIFGAWYSEDASSNGGSEAATASPIRGSSAVSTDEKEKKHAKRERGGEGLVPVGEGERIDAKVSETEGIAGVWELSDDDDDERRQQQRRQRAAAEWETSESSDAGARFTEVSDLLEFVANALAADHAQKTALCNFILQHITNDHLNDGECVVTAENAIQVITRKDAEMYMHAAENLKRELEELKKTCAEVRQRQQEQGQCVVGGEGDDGDCLSAPATAPAHSSNTLTLLETHGGTEGVATLLPVPHAPPASEAVPLEVIKADADIVGGRVSVQQTDSVYQNVLNYQKAFLGRCVAIRNMFSAHLEQNPNDVVTNEFATYYDKMIASVRSAVDENKISEHFSAPVLQMYYDDRNVAPAVSSSDSHSTNAHALVASEYLCGGVVDGPPNFDEPAADVSDTEDPMSGGNVVYNFSGGGHPPANHAVTPAVHRSPGCPARAGGGENFSPTFPAVYHVSPAAVKCAVYFAGIRGEPFRLIPVMRALNVIPRRFLVQNTGLVRVDRLLAVIDRFTGRNSPATELVASLMINSVAKMVNAMRVAYRRGIIKTDKDKFAAALRGDADAMWRSVNEAHGRFVELPATAEVLATAREVVEKTAKTSRGASAEPPSTLVETAEAMTAAANSLNDNLVHIRILRDAGVRVEGPPTKPNPFDMLLTLMLEDWGYRHDVRALARDRAFESTPSKDVENRSVFHSLITATKAMSRFAYNPQSATYMVLLLNRLQRLWNVQMFAVPKKDRTTESYSFRKFVTAVWNIMFDSESDAEFADRYVRSVSGGNEMCHLVCETAFAMWDSVNMHAIQYPGADSIKSWTPAPARRRDDDDTEMAAAMEVVEEPIGRRPVAELNPLLFVADLLPVRIPYADAGAVLDVAYALQPLVGDDAYRLFAVAKLCARADSIVASAPYAQAMRACKRSDVFRAMWDLTMNGIEDGDDTNDGGRVPVPGGEGAAGIAAACAALGLRDDVAEQLIGVALEVRSALNFSVVLPQDNLYLKVSRVYAAYGHDTRYGFLPVHVRAVIDDLNYMSMFAAGARVNHKHVVSEAWRVAVDADYSRQLASDANIWNWKVFAPGPDTSPEDLQKHEAVVAMLQRSPAYAAKVQTAARVYALFKREAFVRTIRRIRNTMTITKSAVQAFPKKNDHPGILVSRVQELVAHVAKTAKAYCDAESSFAQFFHVGENEDDGEDDVAMDMEDASHAVVGGGAEDEESSGSLRAKVQSEKEKRRSKLRGLATDMYRHFERFMYLMDEANESLVRCRGVHVVALQEEIRRVLSARFHSTERLVAHINAVRKLVAETDYPEVDRQNVRFLLRNAWCMTGHAKGDTEYMYYLTQAMMYLPLSGRGADAHSIVCSYQTVVENVRRNRRDSAAATNYDNPILDAFDYYVAGDANGYLPCEFYASASTVDMVAAYYKDGHYCQMMRFLLRYFAGLVHMHTEKRYNYGVVYALEQKGELHYVDEADGGGCDNNPYTIGRDAVDAMATAQLRPLGVEPPLFSGGAGGNGDDGADQAVGVATPRKRKHAGAYAGGADESCPDKNFAHPAMLPVTYPLENTRDSSVTDFSLPALDNAYYFDNDKFLELYILACSHPEGCRAFASEATRANAMRRWSSAGVRLPSVHRTSNANATNAPTSLQVVMLTDFMGQLMKTLRRACDVPVVAHLVKEVAAGNVPLDAVMRSAWRHYWLVNQVRARTAMKTIAAFGRDCAYRANALTDAKGESWDDHVYHIFMATRAVKVEPVVLDRFMMRCDPAVLNVPQNVFTRMRHAVFVRIAAELSGEKTKKLYRVENKCIQDQPIVAPRFFFGVPKKAPSPSSSSYSLSASAMAALFGSVVAMNVFVEHYTVVYHVLQDSFENKISNAMRSTDDALHKRNEMYERVEAMRSRTYSVDEWNKFMTEFGAYMPTDNPELIERFRADVEEMHSFVTRQEQRQIIYERCMARYDDSAAHCADFAAVDSAVSMPHRVMRDARNYFGIHSRDAATGRAQVFASSMKTNIVALNRLLLAKLTLSIGSYVSLESIYALVDALDLVNRAYIVSALNEEAIEDSMTRTRRAGFVSILANILRYCTPAFVREIVLTNERRVSSLGTLLSWDDYMDFTSNARDIMLEYFLMKREDLANDIAPLVEQIKALPPGYLVPRFADRCNELIVSRQMQEQITLTMKQFENKYGRENITVVQASLIDDDDEDEPPESGGASANDGEGKFGDEDDPFVSALPSVADDEAFATFLRDVRAKFARAKMDTKQQMECDEKARTGTKRSWGDVVDNKNAAASADDSPPAPAPPLADPERKKEGGEMGDTMPPQSAPASESSPVDQSDRNDGGGGESPAKKDGAAAAAKQTRTSSRELRTPRRAEPPPERTPSERPRPDGGVSDRKRRVQDQRGESQSTDDSDDDEKPGAKTTKKRLESRDAVAKFEAIMRRPVDPHDRTALAKLVLDSARVCYLDAAVSSAQRSAMSALLCDVLTKKYSVPAVADACARWPRRNRQWMDWIPEVLTTRLFSHVFFVDDGAHEKDRNEASYLELVTCSINATIQSPGYRGVGVNDAGVLRKLVKFLSELFSHKFPRADAKLLVEFQSPLDSLSLPASIEFGTITEYFSYANRCLVTDDAVFLFTAFVKVYRQCVVDALAGGDASRPPPTLFGEEMRAFIDATYSDDDRANCPSVAWCRARCAPARGEARGEGEEDDETCDRVSALILERRKRPFATFVDYQKRYTRFECSKFVACANVLHDPLPPDEKFVSPFEIDCYDPKFASVAVSLSKELRSTPMVRIRRETLVQSFYALAPISGATGLVPRFDHIPPTQEHARELPVKPWETYRENMLRAAVNNLTLYPFRDVVGSYVVPHAISIGSASQPDGWSTSALCDTGGVFNVQIRFRHHSVSASTGGAGVRGGLNTDNPLHVYFTVSTEYVSRSDQEPVCYRAVLDGSQQFSFNWLDCVCYELQYVYERYAPIEYPHQVITRSMCLLFKWASVLTTFTSSVKCVAHAFGSVCGVVASVSNDVVSNASSNDDFHVRIMTTTAPTAASKSRLVYNPYAMLGVGVNERGCFSSSFHYPFSHCDVDSIRSVNVRSALSAIDFDFSWFRSACSKHRDEYRSHTAGIAIAYLNEMFVAPTGAAAPNPSSSSDSSPRWLTVSTDAWTQRLLHVPAKEFRAMNPECASAQYETRVPHGFTMIHNRQLGSTHRSKPRAIVSITVDECEQFFTSKECENMLVDVLPYTSEHAYMTVADRCGDATRRARYNVASDVVAAPVSEELRRNVEKHAKTIANDTLPQLRTHAFLAHRDGACITQSLVETQLDSDVGSLCRHIIAARDDAAVEIVGAPRDTFRVGDERLCIRTRLSAFVREMMMYPGDGTMPHLTIACASSSVLETAYKAFVALPMAPLTALARVRQKNRKSSGLDDDDEEEVMEETSGASAGVLEAQKKCDGDALVRLGLYELVAQILSESQSKYSYADLGAYASRLTEYEYRRDGGGAKETVSSTNLTVGHLLALLHHVMERHSEAARLASIVASPSSADSRAQDDEALILAVDAAREGMCTHALWNFLQFDSLRRQVVLFHATVSVQTGRRQSQVDYLPAPTAPSAAYRQGRLDFEKPPPPVSPRRPVRGSATSPASSAGLPRHMRPGVRKQWHGDEKTPQSATKLAYDTSSSDDMSDNSES